MRNLQLLLFGLALTLTISCKKQAGEGGQATIKGKIWVQDWNSGFTIKNGEYAAMDEDVYIIYGNNVSYNDRIKTNYKGEFEFKYLRKGQYTIYVYSKDNTLKSQSGDTSFVRMVEITSKKQILNIEQITIYK